MLELVNVAKTYESPGSSEQLDVLKDISLDMKWGESIAVVGPSGSGKSTLLNIIGAMDKPSAGKVLLEGRDLADMNETELAHIRNHRIGFVFQSHHLLSQCTVLENVLIPTLASDTKKSAKALKEKTRQLEKAGLKNQMKHYPGELSGGRNHRRECEERALELLESVGLKDHLSHRPGELSGGQRQRVAVVRALINTPALLLADEPTGSLDRQATDNIIELLVELNLKHRLALIVVTHSMRLAERMGRVFQLSDGVLRNGADIE